MKKSLGFIIATLIASAIIAVAHAVVYEAILAIMATLFFASLPPVASAVFFWIFVFLAVCFLAATFISMKCNNRLVRAFYVFSAGWTGFAIYFFFAAFVYGALCAVFASFSATVPAATSFISAMTIARVGAALMVAAFFTGLYGIYTANTIRLIRMPVSLPGLPASWKNRKAVWVSDIHLGHVRGKSFAKKVTDTILSLQPDVVFVGGDLYDGSKVDADAIAAPFHALCRSEGGAGSKPIPLGVYFIMGNHEEFHDLDAVRYAAAVRNIGMKILDDELADIEGVQIIGVDHGHTDNADKFTTVLEKIAARDRFDRTRPSILLKHEPRDLAVGARAGISFQISGHTHRGQIFPVSWITWLTFKGFDYGMKKFTGANSGAMQVYTSSGVGTWGPPMRVGTRSEIVIFTFNDGNSESEINGAMKPKRNWGVFLSSVFFVLGFSAVFSLVGVLLQTVLSHATAATETWLGYFGGVIIILFGLFLLGLFKPKFLERSHTVAVKKRFGSYYATSFVFGAAFAVGWTPCVSAALGAILALAATQATSAFLLLFAYTLGIGIPFLLVGLFTNQAQALINRAGKWLTYFEYIFGALLAVIGIFIFTGDLSRIANVQFLADFLDRLNFGTTAGGSISSLSLVNASIAFIAGLGSFLSPCILPIIPGFLSYLASTAIKKEGR